MAQYGFDDPMAGVQAVQRSGGWKALLWFALAAAGVGFAGYVFLVPYQRAMNALNTRTAELTEERAGIQGLTAERDKLKAAASKQEATDKEKAGHDAQRKRNADALAAQLKIVVDGLGASVASEEGRLSLSFPSDKMIDKNGIDVSEAGTAALKMVASSIKKTGGSVRIKARFGAALAPKELRGLFHTIGEVSAVRAARVMSLLQGAGLPPERLTIIGEAEKAGGGKSKKASPGADRLDIEVEPE